MPPVTLFSPAGRVPTIPNLAAAALADRFAGVFTTAEILAGA